MNKKCNKSNDIKKIIEGLRVVDREILIELQFATRNGEWLAPINFGGSNGSPHNYVLGKLCKLNLAERKKRFGLNSGVRGSYVYRATAKVHVYYEKLRAKRKVRS